MVLSSKPVYFFEEAMEIMVRTASTSRNFYTSIQKKHPVVLSQRVFFMIHSILVLFY